MPFDPGSSRRLSAIALAGTMALSVIPGTVLAKKVNIKWFMSGPAPTQFAAVAKKYEKLHPGITVTILNGDMDKFYTMITAGMMPDIWGPYSTPGIKADVNRSWARDITPYIQRDAKAMDLADFYPGMMQKFRVNGKQYALPFLNWQDYFLYRTDLYDQAGLSQPPMDNKDKSWNWDHMVENAKKLTKFDASGKMTMAGVDFERTITHNAAYLQMWDAHPYSAEALKNAVPQKIDYSSQNMVNAFTKVHDLIYKHKVASSVIRTMEDKKLAQLFNSGWHIQYLSPAKNVKWAITNLPWGETNKGTMWPDGWRMSKITKNPEEVWSFIKYLCSKEVLEYLVTTPNSPLGAVPMARKSVFAGSLGPNLAKLTGMKQSDVLRITDQADDVNEVKYHDLICVHADLSEKFLDPIVNDLWLNKLSPNQAAKKLQDVSDRQLPILFSRWIRNIKFTGKEAK